MGIRNEVDRGDTFCNLFLHQEYYKSKSNLKKNTHLIIYILVVKYLCEFYLMFCSSHSQDS